MKLQQIIRSQVILAGLGSTLLIAGATRAQEIFNTEFSDGPNVVAFEKAAPVQARAMDQKPEVAVMTPAAAMKASTPIATAKGAVVQAPEMRAWLTPTVLISTTVIALYALLEARRARRNLQALTGGYAPRGA